MRIAYINHGRFPTEKAHGFQIAQVCDALQDLGHQLTVFSPNFRNFITAAPQQYYGLRHPLRVEFLEHYDAFQSSFIPGFLGMVVSMRSYGSAVQRRLANKALHAMPLRQDHSEFDVIYLRSPLLLSASLHTNIPVILELHSLPRFARRRFIRGCNRCALVVCLTTPMRDMLVDWGVDPARVIVEADAVDLRRFEPRTDAASAKWRWKLPADRTVIGYVGSLATRETLEKGVRELIDAAAFFKDREHAPLFWIVGGPQKWQKIYEEHARSLGLDERIVRFQGHIDAAAVPSALAACDLCIYPAPKTNHEYFMRDTSPLKLFEYLAAGRPVVCADIPPIRDVVDDDSARLFAPGDARTLADAVTDVLQHPEKASSMIEHGKTIAEEHSWEKRMERIFATLPSHT